MGIHVTIDLNRGDARFEVTLVIMTSKIVSIIGNGLAMTLGYGVYSTSYLLTCQGS